MKIEAKTKKNTDRFSLSKDRNIIETKTNDNAKISKVKE